MNIKYLCFAGFFVLLLVLSPQIKSDTNQSPLLKLAQDLHCAKSGQNASDLLKKLSELPLEPFGIPNEALSDGQNAELYAATVDILLKVLYETIQRYPELQEQTEQVALLWSYCDTVNDGELADIQLTENGQMVKKVAMGPFPALKQGFGTWGFFQKKESQHYVPKILNYPSLYPRVYQDLLHRLSEKQCFPMSDKEEKASHPPYSGFLQLTEILEEGKKYPYVWYAQCSPSEVETPKPIKKTVEKFVTKNDSKAVIQPQPVEVLDHSEEIHKKSLPTYVKKPQQIITKYPKTKKTKQTKKSIISNFIADKYTQPKNDEKPIISPAIPSGNSNIGAQLPLPPENGLGIAGNFFHRAKLTGELSFGANASWKPYSYFFVRGGVNYNYLPGNGKFSYSWGLGYDDWHQGTFSAQINNWGPITPGDDLLKGAVANFGYKFVADFLKPYHLSGSASLNVPFSGDPSISTTWMWSPINYWFVRVSLSKSLTSSGGLDWSYSFGYSDWHPFTFSLTYDNWGSNPIFDSSQGNSFNFTEKGAISLSWSWAF